MNSDHEGERLLWNSHELSSISLGREDHKRSLTYCGRVMICLAVPGTGKGRFVAFITFVILLLHLITDWVWMKVFQLQKLPLNGNCGKFNLRSYSVSVCKYERNSWVNRNRGDIKEATRHEDNISFNSWQWLKHVVKMSQRENTDM